ncbi:hypothetical protein [Roseovarius amoyensis]|uniref:hypothetical protein n=1 Tax=Roseovarius amoyensis TaxID=2211448 RepID=UPI001EF8CD1B|nr:hypothetical protein [Roseovarius amoyensis]
MPLPQLKNDRFIPEGGLRIVVQVPDAHVQRIIDAVLTAAPLRYGGYDRVIFRTAPGIQQFRSLGTGRNVATETAVEVPCAELSFFIARDDAATVQVLKAVYAAHPYEEPLIHVIPCLRTLHIHGLDEDNPNRFWNREPEDWVPEPHR